MFPTKRQQIIIALLVIAIVVLQRAVAIHNHGAGFIVLSPVDHAAVPVGAVGVIIGFIVLGLIGAVTGNPLAGYAVLATGLMMLGWRGGPIDQWLADVQSPRMYFALAGELAMWCVPVLVMALLVRYVRSPLRDKLPGVLQCTHYDEGPQQEQLEPVKHAGLATLPIIACVAVVFMLQPACLADYFGALVMSLACMAIIWGVCLGGIHLADIVEKRERQMRTPIGPAFLAGVVTVAVGAVGVQLLVRVPTSGQVVGGLMLSFMVAAMIGHQLFPTHGRLTMLLAPIAVGVGAYVWTGWHVGNTQLLLELFYQSGGRGLLPAAVVLPIYYASAGVLGSAIGIGWSQSLHLARDEMVLVSAS